MARPPDLPDYENPPIAEVVLGLQFSTEKPLKAPHLGIYWSLVRDDFPTFEEHPPIARKIEPLENGELPLAQTPPTAVFSGSPPLPRLWFVDLDGSKLIQLQKDRFLHNWRKEGGDEQYPRFEELWKEFSRRWKQFVAFAESEKLGEVRITQAELTYINHVSKDSGWASVADAADLFVLIPDLRGLQCPRDAETLTTTAAFRLPKGSGRLHVEVAPAVRVSDGQLLYRMTLTARGPTADSSDEAVASWFDASRRTIVESFTALTKKKAHEHWERTK